MKLVTYFRKPTLLLQIGRNSVTVKKGEIRLIDSRISTNGLESMEQFSGVAVIYPTGISMEGVWKNWRPTGRHAKRSCDHISC